MPSEKTKRKKVRLEAELRIDGFGVMGEVKRETAFIDARLPKTPPVECTSNNIHKIIDYLVTDAEAYCRDNKKANCGQSYPYEINIKIVS